MLSKTNARILSVKITRLHHFTFPMEIVTGITNTEMIRVQCNLLVLQTTMHYQSHSQRMSEKRTISEVPLLHHTSTANKIYYPSVRACVYDLGIIHIATTHYLFLAQPLWPLNQTSTQHNVSVRACKQQETGVHIWGPKRGILLLGKRDRQHT